MAIPVFTAVFLGVIPHILSVRIDGASANTPVPWKTLLTKKKRLGSGFFAHADLMELKEPCEGQAVRKVISTCSQKKNWIHEVDVMSNMSHPNIIGFIDAHPRQKEEWCKGIFGKPPIILMELAKGGEMNKFMNSIRPGWYASRIGKKKHANRVARRDVKVRMILMALVDLLRGLVALHAQGWVHRDIRDDNLWEATGDTECVASGTCNFMLGDLGLARPLDKQCTVTVETEQFPCHRSFVFFVRTANEPQPVQAPEVYNEKFWSPKGDAFHLAATLELMFLAKQQHDINGNTDAKTQTLRDMFTSKDVYDDVSEEVKLAHKGLKSLLLSMTQRSYKDRPTVGESLSQAEKLYEDLYNKPKPLRTTNIPKCLAECAKCSTGAFCEAIPSQLSGVVECHA